MLPTVGQLVYNGFAFGPYTETTSMKVSPKRDSSGRTVLYNVYRFTFRTFLKNVSNSRNDPLVIAARRALTKSGADFTYTGRGFGDIRVNQGAVRDVAWGPWPQELAFKPVGADQTCTLEWSLEVAVPDCADAAYSGRVMEFAYSVTFDRDAAGYSTRSIAGHLTIPQTRIAPGRNDLAESADDYRELVDAPVPVGYRRKWGSFRLDESKTRLDFTFSDEEMHENIPPPGVIEAHARHRLGSTKPGLLFWTGTLSAEYTLEKKADPAVCLRAFFTLLNARITFLGANLKFADQKGDAKPGQSIIPVACDFEEPEIYGPRKVNISLSYSFGGPLGAALGLAGLWRPVPGSDWGKWSASLEGGFHHVRAGARLTFAAGDDRLVDLCGPAPVALVATTDLPQAQLPYGPNDAQRERQLIGKALFTQMVQTAFPPPQRETSWVSYECEVFVEMESGTIPLRLLPAGPLTETTDLVSGRADFAGPAGNDALSGELATEEWVGTVTASASDFKATPGTLSGGGVLDAEIAPGQNPPSARVQRRTRPLVYVYLRGRAVRAGYEVPVPRLTDIDGQEPVPANRLDCGEGYTSSVVFAAGGVPLYKARWNLRYLLPAVPNRLPVPPNPLLGADR